MSLIWLTSMDIVSETARIPLLETSNLSVMEFLNLLNYNKHKTEKINKQYKKNGI